MFFIVSKLLKTLLFPLTWILGLLLAGCLVRKARVRGWLVGIAIALTLLFSNRLLLETAQYYTTRHYETQTLPNRHYQVALVMGGFGLGMNEKTGQPAYLYDRGARLWEAVRLKQMGLVDQLLISGDELIAIDNKGQSTAPAFLSYMRSLNIPDSCILLEQQARNTRENATLTIALLDSLSISPHDCLLITSASHLQRAAGCFAAEGWTLDTYAVNIYPRPRFVWTGLLPNWKALTHWQELINEWAGTCVYHLMGYHK